MKFIKNKYKILERYYFMYIYNLCLKRSSNGHMYFDNYYYNRLKVKQQIKLDISLIKKLNI